MDEHEARDLLHRAAETVDVGPDGPLDTPTSVRRWPVLVAAAAAVVVLVTGITLAHTMSTPTSLAPVTQPSAVTTAQPAGQMPSLLGYTRDEAVALLRDTYGLAVDVSTESECDFFPGEVVRSRPAPGTDLIGRPTVGITVSSKADCITLVGSQEAFDLLHFARGLGGSLELAPRVSVYAGAEPPTTLTGRQRSDPAAWDVCGSDGTCANPLASLVTAADTPVERNGVEVQAQLFGADNSLVGCRSELPPGFPKGTTIVVSVEAASVGQHCATGQVLAMVLDGDGAVEAVAAVAPLRGRVSDNSPGVRGTIAREFVRFAHHGEAPAFADRVDLLLGNQLITTISGDQAAQERSTWQVCTPPGHSYAERSCPLSALAQAGFGRAVVTPTQALTYGACTDVLGALPADLGSADALRHSISLAARRPPSCGADRQVQLWYDAEDRIDAVNLVLGSP